MQSSQWFPVFVVARDDRLPVLGRDHVVRARGRGHGEVDVVRALGGRQHEMEVDARRRRRAALEALPWKRVWFVPIAAGRDVRIVRVTGRDRDPRRRRGQHAADRVRIGVAGVADPLVEPEVLARVDVAVRVAVEQRRQVVDEVRRRWRRRPDRLLVEEHVLLGGAADQHAPVDPGDVVRGGVASSCGRSRPCSRAGRFRPAAAAAG